MKTYVIAPTLHRFAHASGLSTRLARRQRAPRIISYHGVTRAAAPRFAAQIRYLMRHFSIVPLRAIVDRIVAGVAPDPEMVALTFDDGLRNNRAVVYPILEQLGATATFFVCPGLIDARRWLWEHEVRERMGSLAPVRRAALERSAGKPAGASIGIVDWMKTLPAAARRDVENVVRAATPAFTPGPAERERCDLMTWDDLAALDPRVVEIGSHTVTHAMLPALGPVDVMTEIEEIGRAHV